MAKKEKAYITSISDMVEGKPMTREAFKNLTLAVADEWVKENHPEIKDEWIDICQNEQEIVKLFPEKKKTVTKLDKDGKPIMRTMKKRNGTVVEVEDTQYIPYLKGEKRILTVFEINTWLCEKYNMLPKTQGKIVEARKAVGNW